VYRFFSPLFWLCSVVFTAHQIIEKWWSIPIIHAYLDDFLAPSIVLGLALTFFQQIFPADAEFVLPWYFVLFFVFWYALLFEWYFPAVDKRHYSDIVDVAVYFSGSVLFFFKGNKAIKPF
jgi:hypothetical protein